MRAVYVTLALHDLPGAPLSAAVLLGLLLAAPPPAPDALAEVRAQVATLSARVEALRGLRFKRPVAVQIVSPEQARAYFVERAAKVWPPEQVALDQSVYAQLGLVPDGTDLMKVFLDLLEEQARGYYDPGAGTLFLVEGMQSRALTVVMAHELTHALDDQHFDLEALGQRATDDDRSTALSAVVEGSATAVMAAYLAQEMLAGRLSGGVLQEIQDDEARGSERLEAAPPYLQRTLLAPYALGMPFLLRGSLQGLASGAVPAADFDQALASPPESTEQVLHPEKYWDKARFDPPVKLTLPDLSATLGKGWVFRGEGRLGELGMAVLTGARLPNPRSSDAALASKWTGPASIGLAGDLFQHYFNGAQRLTLLATLWDSEADAREFASALTPVAGRRSYRFGAAVLLVAGDVPERFDELAPLTLGALSGAARK